MKKPSFITLLIMICFASVNAVLFTPALPNIANYFAITTDTAQLTIIWFLIGYTFGQLLYGPLANRFGRKPALYIGISLQILSCLICILSKYTHLFQLLVLGRFFLALGSGAGLQITFTLVNECYEPKIASQKISYLLMAFAIMPGVSVALGGLLNQHWGWVSCFYAAALYGVLLLLLTTQLPESKIPLNKHALRLKNLWQDYSQQLKNSQLVACGIIMANTTCFIYIFAAFAPFLAINFTHMTSAEYGFNNLLTQVGLLMGSFASAQLIKKVKLKSAILIGLCIAMLGSFIMLIAMMKHVAIIYSLFIPMSLILFGLCFILANSSTIALSNVSNKSHGSAVMNFLNVGLATCVVSWLTYLPVKMLLLPMVFLGLIAVMFVLYTRLIDNSNYSKVCDTIQQN